MKALELGAVDFVSKPRLGVVDGLGELSDQIVDKVRVAAKANVRRISSVPISVVPVSREKSTLNLPVGTPKSNFSTEKLVFIGASTGGTEAIKEILIRLPADFPAVLVTQHMPPGFTKTFAARLNGLSKLAVQEAVNGERLLPGHAYIAPGGMQFSVDRSGANYLAVVEDGPPVNRHKPSVEVLFKSAAKLVGRNACGVLLTGMGNDGARALREMKDAGSYNYVQDEASCIVFGMPREAILQGAADEVLPPAEIAQSLISRFKLTPDRYRI